MFKRLPVLFIFFLIQTMTQGCFKESAVLQSKLLFYIGASQQKSVRFLWQHFPLNQWLLILLSQQSKCVSIVRICSVLKFVAFSSPPPLTEQLLVKTEFTTLNRLQNVRQFRTTFCQLSRRKGRCLLCFLLCFILNRRVKDCPLLHNSHLY